MFDGFMGICQVLYYGSLQEAKRNKYVAGFYALAAFWIFACIVAQRSAGLLLGVLAVFIFSFALGARYYLTHILPGIRMRAIFSEAFEDIELKTKKCVPYYMKMEQGTYTTTYKLDLFGN